MVNGRGRLPILASLGDELDNEHLEPRAVLDRYGASARFRTVPIALNRVKERPYRLPTAAHSTII